MWASVRYGAWRTPEARPLQEPGVEGECGSVAVGGKLSLDKHQPFKFNIQDNQEANPEKYNSEAFSIFISLQLPRETCVFLLHREKNCPQIFIPNVTIGARFPSLSSHLALNSLLVKSVHFTNALLTPYHSH